MFLLDLISILPAPGVISLSPLSSASDVTVVKFGASDLWLGTRAGAGGTATLTKSFFFWRQPCEDCTVVDKDEINVPLHKPSCVKNYEVTGGGMEMTAPLAIYHRSEVERGVRYVEYLGGGMKTDNISILFPTAVGYI